MEVQNQDGIVGASGYYPYDAHILKIVSCVNFGDVSSGIIGVIFDKFTTSLEIKNCYNSGIVKRTGITDVCKEMGTIENCYNIGECIQNEKKQSFQIMVVFLFYKYLLTISLK